MVNANFHEDVIDNVEVVLVTNNIKKSYIIIHGISPGVYQRHLSNIGRQDVYWGDTSGQPKHNGYVL
jgi:hypothetical protein